MIGVPPCLIFYIGSVACINELNELGTASFEAEVLDCSTGDNSNAEGDCQDERSIDVDHNDAISTASRMLLVTSTNSHWRRERS